MHKNECLETASHEYERLAAFVSSLVEAGALTPGSRVPSLRRISEERRVSVGTALQAYRLLEARGVLEARPQSGYFVAQRRASCRLPLPEMSKPSRRPADIAVSDIMLDLLERASDPSYVPLGCAVPSRELLAATRLDRILARIARRQGMEYNVYGGPRGDVHLRQEIARRASHWEQVIPPDDIAITSGCTEALMLALRVVADANDTIAVESPTYFGLLRILETLGLKVLEVPTDASSGIDLTALAGMLSKNSIKACLVSSSFNNPLGCTMPDEKKRALVQLLAKHGVPLIEDDIYGDIYFGQERPRPFMSFDRAGNTIYCSSFSKTIAPGYRIGWIVAGARMHEVLKQKAASTLCGPALTQAAFAEFLASGGYDHHLRRIRSDFARNISHMRMAIADAFPDGTKVSNPAGGFTLWLELPAHINTRTLFGEALEAGICFAPGEVFSATNRYSNCLRLSAGHPWDTRIERAIWKLGDLIRPSRPRPSPARRPDGGAP